MHPVNYLFEEIYRDHWGIPQAERPRASVAMRPPGSVCGLSARAADARRMSCRHAAALSVKIAETGMPRQAGTAAPGRTLPEPAAGVRLPSGPCRQPAVRRLSPSASPPPPARNR